LQILIILSLLSCTLSLSWPGFSTFTKAGRGFRFTDLGWNRRGRCKSEDVKIPIMSCKIEWEEECNTDNKKVGEKVVYEQKCEDKDVKDCKWVQYIHPKFPSLGIHGGTTEDVECSKVTKEFCREVPKKEDVMADVETCVNTPKQVCEEDSLLTWKKTCDRIVAGTEESAESDAENIDPEQLEESERKSKSDEGDDEKNDEDDNEENDAASIEDEDNDASLGEYDDTSTDDEASSDEKGDNSPK